MQNSAGIQIFKYKAFVLRHSPTSVTATSVVETMSNTNNSVVGDLKPCASQIFIRIDIVGVMLGLFDD